MVVQKLKPDVQEMPNAGPAMRLLQSTRKYSNELVTTLFGQDQII